MIAIAPHTPVLIAGPTASGKSALALAIAQQQGGVVVNADALQVFADWRVLTARPGAGDLACAPHALYGHVAQGAAYSVGHWLRDLEPLLTGAARPIIVGGTGLNFAALTRGLAAIPPTPADVRAQADQLTLPALIAGIDAVTRGQIDLRNRMRAQRAWEVQVATGRGLAQWQTQTPPPRLPLADTAAITLDAPKDWLEPRITHRFDAMLAGGALDEARTILPRWNPQDQSAKAIGAAELVAYLRGDLTLDRARAAAIVASRQYAKRQRTWFRARHGAWLHLRADAPDLLAAIALET